MKKIKIIDLIKNKEFIGYSPIIEEPGMNPVMFLNNKEPMVFCSKKEARRHAEEWIISNSKIQLFMGEMGSGKSYQIDQLLKDVKGSKSYILVDYLVCFNWKETKHLKVLIIQGVLTLNELEMIASYKDLCHCLIYVTTENKEFDIVYLQALGYEVNLFLNEHTPKQQQLITSSN